MLDKVSIEMKVLVSIMCKLTSVFSGLCMWLLDALLSSLVCGLCSVVCDLLPLFHNRVFYKMEEFFIK